MLLVYTCQRFRSNRRLRTRCTLRYAALRLTSDSKSPNNISWTIRPRLLAERQLLVHTSGSAIECLEGRTHLGARTTVRRYTFRPERGSPGDAPASIDFSLHIPSQFFRSKLRR